VAGVISRAAFGKSAGAKSQVAQGVTGVILIAFIVFGGGALLASLPKAGPGHPYDTPMTPL